MTFMILYSKTPLFAVDRFRKSAANTESANTEALFKWKIRGSVPKKKYSIRNNILILYNFRIKL